MVPFTPELLGANMSERFVEANGVTLWTESFGEASAPLVLLITGLGGQGISWNSELCRQLAASGFRVVRYDHRDTGRSSKIDYAEAPYLLEDLAADASGVLDAY